jgi:DNA-binding MarR family transcriptional regulator
MQAAETLDAFASLWRRLIPPEGVSMTAGSTLGSLLHAGPLRLTALAEREAVSQPAMTGLISRLEASGLAVRSPDPSDGRAVLVALTAQGRALIEGRRSRRAEALAALLAQLGPDEHTSVDAAIPVLQRLIEHATHNRTTYVEESR